MKQFTGFTVAILLLSFFISSASAQDTVKVKEQKSDKLNQYYSVKFGFYQPGTGLNNGLLIGIDGITEFLKYNFFLSGAIDLYPKQTFDMFDSPGPSISDQQIYLIPIHINGGYKIADFPDADSRIYAGGGIGYYLFFYSYTYSSSSGGLVGGLNSSSDSKNGGNVFATLFARGVIGKIFVEPRVYLAVKSSGNLDGYNYTVNPTGFAVTFGFQYHQ
ncbi:MAG TPA: hypothetical protein VKS81_04205 [Bacteroidota bacterium]|nr:hypothetical protein [Bacteroidota bacterium]